MGSMTALKAIPEQTQKAASPAMTLMSVPMERPSATMGTNVRTPMAATLATTSTSVKKAPLIAKMAFHVPIPTAATPVKT